MPRLANSRTSLQTPVPAAASSGLDQRSLEPVFASVHFLLARRQPSRNCFDRTPARAQLMLGSAANSPAPC